MAPLARYAWSIPSHESARIAALAEALQVSRPLAALLLSRGLDTSAKLTAFFHPTWDRARDGRAFRNGEAAVARLVQAIQSGERILIHGDYDVDGTCGAVIYHRALKGLGGHVNLFLPSRFRDGFGVAERAIRWGLKQGYTLLVTADTGSQAYEQVELARSAGMDVIVTDHHELGSRPLATDYFINPQQEGCPYPFKGLSGGGIALKVSLAVAAELGRELDATDFLPLATLSTVADVCPLVDENRALVTEGLRRFPHTRHPGLRALLQSAKTDGRALVVKDLSHGLIPRLNAIGRLGHPELAAKLLLEDSPGLARGYAQEAEATNNERRAIQERVTEEAMRLALQQLERDPACLVVASPQWHFGVLGIVAARLVETYGRPAIVLSQHQSQAQLGAGHAPYPYSGSGRAPAGCDLLSAVRLCESLLQRFGGHAQALGLTLDAEQLPRFRSALNEVLASQTPAGPPELAVDAWLSPGDFSIRLCQELARLEPCGAGNPEPLFAIGPVYCISTKTLGNGNHRRLTFRGQEWEGFEAVHFQCPRSAPPDSTALTVIGTPVHSEFRGEKRLELHVKDIGEHEANGAMLGATEIGATASAVVESA